MRDTRYIMGMPVTVEIVDGSEVVMNAVFDYFTAVDERFSTYKSESEITKINRGTLTADDYSAEMREIFSLAETTRKDTDGYFSITRPDGSLDPSGLVKGWAIRNAAQLVVFVGQSSNVFRAKSK